MPNDTLDQAANLVDQYLELQSEQDLIQEKLSELKKVIASFSRKTNQKQLKSGNTILKVRQYQKTVFPKIEQKGREEIEEIMRKSKEWKQAITFDIVKLGLAYDKKTLSENLIDKLKPFADSEAVIRIAKSKLRKKKKHEKKD